MIICRNTVRGGWFTNSHVNLPVEVRDLQNPRGGKAEIFVDSQRMGKGSVNATTGQLTGMADALQLLGFGLSDKDTAELRIVADEPGTGLRVFFSRAPNASDVIDLDGAGGFVVAPRANAEVFLVDETHVVGYLPPNSNPTSPSDADWLDEPFALPTGTAIGPANASSAQQLFLALMNATWRPRSASASASNVGADGADAFAEEGDAKVASHRIRERNRGLVQQKKKAVMAQTGRLECEVCAMQFSAVYGLRGVGFCEVHHKDQIGGLVGRRQTRLDRLAIVCANCHRMLHRPPFCSVDELRTALQLQLSGGQ